MILKVKIVIVGNFMDKIIIAEDDVLIRDELSCLLKKYGYEVIIIDDFEYPIEQILATEGQLLLLDLTLPKYDGFYIARMIRKQSTLPMIVLTSRDSEIDELMSIQLGADDFITKPFNSQILLARIQAVLSRTKTQTNNYELIHDQFRYDMNRHHIICKNQYIELTSNEHLILSLLLIERGTIVSRDTLMNHLWSNHSFVDDNTLTVNVNRVRKKLLQLGLNDIIETKRGEGYIIL